MPQNEFIFRHDFAHVEKWYLKWIYYLIHISRNIYFLSGIEYISKLYYNCVCLSIQFPEEFCIQCKKCKTSNESHVLCQQTYTDIDKHKYSKKRKCKHSNKNRINGDPLHRLIKIDLNVLYPEPIWHKKID